MTPQQRITLVGSVVNLILPAIKFTVGVLGQSTALIADAVHSLSDLVSDLIVYIFVSLSGKPRDHDHDYGHAKYETLATFCIAIFLLIVSCLIASHAVGIIVEYFRNGTLPEAPSALALLVALLSIVSKEILFHLTARVARATNSTAIMANAWHHRSDAYSSVATLLGIAGAIFVPGMGRLLEPVAAFAVALFILHVAIGLALPAMRQLSEQHIGDEAEAEILSIIAEVPDICDPHNLRTRSIGNSYAIEVDVRVDPEMTVYESHACTMEIEHRLRLRFGNTTHIVVHVEPYRTPTSPSE